MGIDEVDFVRTDFARIDLVGVDLVRIDLVAQNHRYSCSKLKFTYLPPTFVCV